jgi:DNA-directed RNA polymerase subunit RPC12/RpoP
VNVQFVCPECEAPARLELSHRTEWQCPACDHLLLLRVLENNTLPACAVCGNSELYKKKNFPHWLGLTILAVACLGSIIPYWLYHQWLTWTILIGSAIFDGLLYLWVGDVVVCYRCNAHCRGLISEDAHKPFELGIAERYRQERLRLRELHAAKKQP